MSCVDKRIEVNQKTVHSAATLLDRRFQGLDLEISDESVPAAENLIITLAQNQQIEQVYILDDLAKYRARQGPYCAVLYSEKLSTKLVILLW